MKSYTLRRVPADIFKIVADEQNKIKKERCANQVSFEYALYKIIRDFKKCEEDKNQKQL